MRWPDRQIATIRDNLLREGCAHGAAAAAAAALGWFYAPSALAPLLAWLGALGGVAGAGLFLVARAPRSSTLRLYVRVHLLLGLLWGAFAFFMNAHWPIAAIALMHAALIVTAVMLLRVTALHPIAYAALVAPALLLFAGAVSMLGSELSTALVMIDLVMMAVLIFEARHVAGLAGNRAVLQAKATEIEERLRWTTGAFRDQQLLARREEALARQVFDRLTHQTGRELSEIRSWVCATGSFSGDLLLYASSPSGNLNILFCDFTGHGLPAALGAIPVSGMFRTMTDDEYSPLEVAREMNQRLATLLPADYFCCACLLRITPDRRRMEVCNAGLPPLLVVDAGGAVKSRYRSKLLPLGINFSDPSAQQQIVELAKDDVVYMFSDGLIESENMHGEMFGLARLEAQLGREVPGASRIDLVRDAVVEFIGAGEPSDDISLIELQLERETSAMPEVA